MIGESENSPSTSPLALISRLLVPPVHHTHYNTVTMVEVSLTVGKLDASLALLLTKDHHLIEFPTILLPNGVKAGSVVKIRCDRDLDTEEEERKQFQAIQDEILETFGKNLPQAPVLKVKNVTQTSCVLEWDQLDLGTATLKNLVLFKDGKKLGSIPQPLTNRTTKLSGLPINKQFKFQLRLDSTAGVFLSEELEVTTHTMTDLSGITVCLGDIGPNEQFTADDIQQTLEKIGAHHPAQDKVKVDTTHFLTTRENAQNPEFVKANDMNVPIVRPEWLKACERERRIVGVREFYVKDCVLPDILGRNYWKKADEKKESPAIAAQDATTEKAEEQNEVVEQKEGEKETGTVEEQQQQEPQTVEEHKSEAETVKEADSEPKVQTEEAVEKAGTQDVALGEVAEPIVNTTVEEVPSQEDVTPAEEPVAKLQDIALGTTEVEEPVPLASEPATEPAVETDIAMETPSEVVTEDLNVPETEEPTTNKPNEESQQEIISEPNEETNEVDEKILTTLDELTEVSLDQSETQPPEADAEESVDVGEQTEENSANKDESVPEAAPAQANMGTPQKSKKKKNKRR